MSRQERDTVPGQRDNPTYKLFASHICHCFELRLAAGQQDDAMLTPSYAFASDALNALPFSGYGAGRITVAIRGLHADAHNDADGLTTLMRARPRPSGWRGLWNPNAANDRGRAVKLAAATELDNRGRV